MYKCTTVSCLFQDLLQDKSCCLGEIVSASDASCRQQWKDAQARRDTRWHCECQVLLNGMEQSLSYAPTSSFHCLSLERIHRLSRNQSSNDYLLMHSWRSGCWVREGECVRGHKTRRRDQLPLFIMANATGRPARSGAGTPSEEYDSDDDEMRLTITGEYVDS